MSTGATIANDSIRLVTRTDLAARMGVRPDGRRMRVLWPRLPLTREDGRWKVRLGKATEIYDRMVADGTLDALIRELEERGRKHRESLSLGEPRAAESVVRDSRTSPAQPARQGATLGELFDGWEK